MTSEHSLPAGAKRAVAYALRRTRRGPEGDKASAYWASLTDYHLRNDDDPAIERSRWIADTVIPAIGARSVLEIGTNSGRSLEYVHRSHPEMTLKGVDVNPRAIEYARAKGLPIAFEVADAIHWTEPVDAWDAVLTMSVRDHIPDEPTELLAQNMARSARHVIAVELWDCSPGVRGVYKYSRDSRALFERHGFEQLTFCQGTRPVRRREVDAVGVRR